MNSLSSFTKCISFSVLLLANFVMPTWAASAEFTRLVNAHIDDIKQTLIDNATQQNRLDAAQKIRETSIFIDDSLTLPGIANAVHDNGREIKISGEFIDALQTVLPEIASIMPMDETLEDTSVNHTLVKLALSDILFHEIGHHVTDSFYGHRASPFKVQWAEHIAERWSLNKKRSMGIDVDNIGKLIALSTAFVSMGGQTPQAAPDRGQSALFLKQMLQQNCQMASSQAATYFCGSFDEAIQDLLGAR